MLHDQNSPKFLWGEATKTTIYIQNQSPHTSLDNMTLEEEPSTFEEVVNHQEWKDAMDEEYQSIMEKWSLGDCT